MTTRESGCAPLEGFLTISPQPEEQHPNLSYLTSSGIDGIFHSFIENEPSGLSSKSDVLPSASDYLDLTHGCTRDGGFVTVQHSCGKTKTLHLPCNSRFACECPECSKRWARKNRKKFESLLLRMRSPKFLTLTLWYDKTTGHCPTLLEIHQMMNALLHRLRYRGYFIGSWFAVVEFPNHLHIVMDSDYIPRDNIVRQWKDITDGSFVVDIRPINTARAGVRPTVKYVTKYITKACGLTPSPEPTQLRLDDDDVIVIKRNFTSSELKGFHIVKSWGNEAIARQPMTCDCGDDSPWHKTAFSFDLPADHGTFSILTTDTGPPSVGSGQ